MTECPLTCFTSNKWGGKIWKKLKEGELESPGWLRLQLAEFWSDKEKYGALHRILNGSAAASCKRSWTSPTPSPNECD